MSGTRELDPDDLELHPISKELFQDSGDPVKVGEDGLQQAVQVTPDSQFTDADWTVIDGNRRVMTYRDMGRDIPVEVVGPYESEVREKRAVLQANDDRVPTDGQQVNYAEAWEDVYKSIPTLESERAPAEAAADHVHFSSSTYYDGRRIKQAAKEGTWGNQEEKLSDEVENLADTLWEALLDGDDDVSIGGAHDKIETAIENEERAQTIKQFRESDNRNVTFTNDTEEEIDIDPLPDPVRSFIWYGNKADIADWIISRMPEHDTYVEPFAGNAAVLLNKPPSRVEVINDYDSNIVNFFEILRDKPKLLKRIAESFDFTKVTYSELADRWSEGGEYDDRPLQAATFFFLIHAEFFGRGDTQSTFDESKASSYYRRIRKIPELHQRLTRDNLEYFTTRFREEVNEHIDPKQKNKVAGLAESRRQDINEGESVRIREEDFEEVVQQYGGEDTLVYADPPYVDTEQPYEGTFTKEDHQRLVDVLNDFEGDWILSYGSEPPADLETEYIEFQGVKRSPGRQQQAKSGEEWLITNIPEKRIGTFETVRKQKPADEW